MIDRANHEFWINGHPDAIWSHYGADYDHLSLREDEQNNEVPPLHCGEETVYSFRLSCSSSIARRRHYHVKVFR